MGSVPVTKGGTLSLRSERPDLPFEQAMAMQEKINKIIIICVLTFIRMIFMCLNRINNDIFTAFIKTKKIIKYQLVNYQPYNGLEIS